jgi:hypothetical protein
MIQGDLTSGAISFAYYGWQIVETQKAAEQQALIEHTPPQRDAKKRIRRLRFCFERSASFCSEEGSPFRCASS